MSNCFDLPNFHRIAVPLKTGGYVDAASLQAKSLRHVATTPLPQGSTGAAYPIGERQSSTLLGAAAKLEAVINK